MTHDGKSRIAMLGFPKIADSQNTESRVVPFLFGREQCKKRPLLVLSTYIRHDVLIEEFQYKRDAIGEHQVLRHKFKLVDVVQFEMLEK